MTIAMETSDPGTLMSAQGGDPAAFEALVEPRRAELHAHCYRMLGSVHDADDAVQETMLRAWRSLPRFEGRSSLRTWLFKIATNVALDVASRTSRRELPTTFGPPADPSNPAAIPVTEVYWIEPYAAARELTSGLSLEEAHIARETIELAYVAALQHLPVRQRAVFILREVMRFRTAQTAEILDTTTAAVSSLLQRARAAVREKLPAVSQQTELETLGLATVSGLARSYARAIEDDDLDALMALLTEDPTWSMPPAPYWYRGREAVVAFHRSEVLSLHWRHLIAWANGQLAVAGYVLDADLGCFVAVALDVLQLRGDRIDSVTGFITPAGLSPDERQQYRTDPTLFSRFGLPSQLPAEGNGPGHVEVSRSINASAHEIFSILAAPASHPRLDGSGMLTDAEDRQAIAGVGDSFLVSMTLESIGAYQMLNRVIRFEPDQLLVWEPTPGDAAAAKAAGLPIGASQGYQWGFELVADGDRTTVTEFFDCRAAPDAIKLAVDNGRMWAPAMAVTLDRLAGWAERS
jgi:RNA polymerase sigma-70 factor, ECF subfamily